MGTGKYATVPEIRNGVCWDYSGPYKHSPVWITDPLYWGNYDMGNWDGAVADSIIWDQAYSEVFITWNEVTDSWNSNPYYFNYPIINPRAGGGSWNSDYTASQYFDYMSNKDIKMDVTHIVDGTKPRDYTKASRGD